MRAVAWKLVDLVPVSLLIRQDLFRFGLQSLLAEQLSELAVQ